MQVLKFLSLFKTRSLQSWCKSSRCINGKIRFAEWFWTDPWVEGFRNTSFWFRVCEARAERIHNCQKNGQTERFQEILLGRVKSLV